MFIVTVENGGYEWFLRSTVWTSDRDRANKFATRELAQAALLKAKQFMKAAHFKKARIEETI